MKRRWLFLCCAVCLTLAGCAAKTGRDSEPALPMPQSTSAAQGEADKNTAQLIPDRLKRDASGVPMLSVYDIKAEKLETLSVEDYLPAVLAGEMAGDWPLEALKAQAILARTFVMQFVSQKKSMYDGADISTDIKEAQAYDASGINEQAPSGSPRNAGMVMNAAANLPYAWIPCTSGG